MLKKVFEAFGIFMLICFSFYYTDKTVLLIRKKDPIMIKIAEEKESYNINPVNATLVGDYGIIPGYDGVEIDETKSFKKMKQVNDYNDQLLVFSEVEPAISTKNNKKYIVSGNSIKNAVSFVFVVKETKQLERILILLKNKNISASFFIDGKWIEDNVSLVYKINNYGNTIHNLGYDSKYENKNVKWTNNLIKELINKKPKYCYTEKEDEKILDACLENKLNTIIPNIIAKNYPLFKVTKDIRGGSIISFDTSETSLDYLTTIINFTQYKGYSIKTIDEHLSEER